jgi:hypothetical protein
MPMGRLRHADTGRCCELKRETLAGRSRSCDVQLEHESASQVHATIRWQAEGWQLQDRNSTNGTWIDGACASRGKTYALVAGSTIRFGPKREESWQMIDDSPPVDSAAALPSTAAYERALSGVELLVRADLSLEVSLHGEVHRMPARTPYIVVQELADERLKDRERGLKESEEGWVDRETLSRRLRRPELNQDIRRIRTDFQKLELLEAAEDVIETHREQGKVRLGISRVRIER